MVGPWLFRLSSDLSEEREARVRSEERADVAAHLHDSVLQTLALIQRSSSDPAAVSRLARAQERDLRSWLFEDPGAGASTLAAALREVAAATEDAHGVPVEVVCVGDAPLTDAERPLVLAAREAITNAARHSGAATIDVYAEASPSVDRGLRPRPRARLRSRRRWPRTGTAYAAASSAGWNATVAPPTCAAPPTRAPRSVSRSATPRRPEAL